MRKWCDWGDNRACRHHHSCHARSPDSGGSHQRAHPRRMHEVWESCSIYPWMSWRMCASWKPCASFCFCLLNDSKRSLCWMKGRSRGSCKASWKSCLYCCRKNYENVHKGSIFIGIKSVFSRSVERFWCAKFEFLRYTLIKQRPCRIFASTWSFFSWRLSIKLRWLCIPRKTHLLITSLMDIAFAKKYGIASS